MAVKDYVERKLLISHYIASTDTRNSCETSIGISGISGEIRNQTYRMQNISNLLTLYPKSTLDSFKSLKALSENFC